MPNVPPPPPPAILQQMPAPSQATSTIAFGQASTIRSMQPVSSFSFDVRPNKPFRILNQRQKRLRDRRIGHNRLRKK